jgi:hypothetical protein
MNLDFASSGWWWKSLKTDVKHSHNVIFILKRNERGTKRHLGVCKDCEKGTQKNHILIAAKNH